MIADLGVRPGGAMSLASLAGLLVCTFAIVFGADAAADLALLFVVPAMMVSTAAVLLGAPLGLACGVALLLAGQLAGLMSADSDHWFRAGFVGVLLFASAELGFDAMQRRDGSTRTSAAQRRWVLARAQIIAGALAVTIIAELFSGGAPVRTLPAQAIIVLVVLGGVAFGAARWAVADTPADAPKAFTDN